LDIVNLEFADKPVPADDVAWIKTIPDQLAKLMLPLDDYYATELKEDDLKCAIITDVFTNTYYDVVLEAGTGIPQRLYVVLNDAQGGKRIAVGFTYSYYEFYHSRYDSLTEEKWRPLVYATQTDMPPLLPFWAKGIALPPRNSR